MSAEKDPYNQTRIAIIGKFQKLYDEEYIARSFEMLGCEVLRIEEQLLTHSIVGLINEFNPQYVIWTKLQVTQPEAVYASTSPYTRICWVFDLYIGYNREYRLKSHPAFKADYVFTTDGGNDEKFKELGINHHCVRQGIWKDECYLDEINPDGSIVFVGSDNPSNSNRVDQLDFIQKKYKDRFKWYGRWNTNEIRGKELNKLYSHSTIVIGDSVYSPKYWSNRVVETLGRGGFLIHQEVEGLKEEYPYLVTYPRGDYKRLGELIDYYTEHEDERQEIIKRNYEWVRDNYTMDKQCQKLLSYISLKTSAKETQTDN